MTRSKIIGTVVRVICEQFGCDNEEVDLKDNLLEDLYADELDMLEIVMALEEEFDIDIDDGDLDDFGDITVEGIVDYIEEVLAG